MAIRFFFEYKGTVIQLPVNPPELALSEPGNNKVDEIVKLGEVNIIKMKKLSTLTIKSFLPISSDAPYVLTKGAFKDPQFYLDFFKKVREDMQPMRLIVSDMGLNMLVSIENFDSSQVAGDPDTHFDLKLMEYRPYGSRVVKITPATSPAAKATISAVTPVRVKKGLAIGDAVIATGKYWASSYGDGPFGTFNNFNGKISHIVADKQRKYRYHITTPTGGYRGWVSESQLKNV